MEEKIANAFKQTLNQSGIKYSFVAKKMGMLEPNFYRRLSGRTRFTFSETMRMCEILGIDPSSLLK